MQLSDLLGGVSHRADLVILGRDGTYKFAGITAPSLCRIQIIRHGGRPRFPQMLETRAERGVAQGAQATEAYLEPVRRYCKQMRDRFVEIIVNKLSLCDHAMAMAVPSGLLSGVNRGRGPRRVESYVCGPMKWLEGRGVFTKESYVPPETMEGAATTMRRDVR